MSEPSFQTERVREAAQLLSHTGKIAFALSCAERLYRNYCAFTTESGWGDPRAIRQSLDFGWDILAGGVPHPGELQRLRRAVEAVEPETEDFSSVLVSPALDAAAVAELLLDLLERDDIEIVAEIASLCRDTVDMYVQELESMAPNAPDLEAMILQHPLMQAELRRQREDLDTLVSFSPSPKRVNELIALWREPERSNIGLTSFLP